MTLDEIKKYIISNDLDLKYRQYLFSLHNGLELEEFYLQYNIPEDFISIIENLNKSRYQRILRVKKRIYHMFHVSNDVYFLTFTFNNEILNNTCFDTRRQYIRRLLSSCCDDFVANVDFGKENEREHYHAIAIINNFEILDLASKWGFYNKKLCNHDVKDGVKLSKYINKLTYHCLKNSTKNYNLIYKRI